MGDGWMLTGSFSHERVGERMKERKKERNQTNITNGCIHMCDCGLILSHYHSSQNHDMLTTPIILVIHT